MSKIGVLDSGLGGMVMMKHLIERYPQQDFIFLADQIHSPYGQKSETELVGIVNQNVRWLIEKGADSILFACNTISCLNPSKIDQTVPIERVVGPTCAQLKDSSYRRILVCATAFTVSSQVYTTTLQNQSGDVVVLSCALPYLCTDIEQMLSHEKIEHKLVNDLEPYVGHIDAVILGCTHYPVIKHLFEKILDVPVFDSNGILLTYSSCSTGNVDYYTTADPEKFDKQCAALFQMKIMSQKAEL